MIYTMLVQISLVSIIIVYSEWHEVHGSYAWILK